MWTDSDYHRHDELDTLITEEINIKKNATSKYRENKCLHVIINSLTTRRQYIKKETFVEYTTKTYHNAIWMVKHVLSFKVKADIKALQ